MKPPQRRFVVEFKSGRRLAKARTDSIWGNTDLKAFARQVEDESSHLFGTNETGGNTGVKPAPDADILVPADEQVAVASLEPPKGALLESEAHVGLSPGVTELVAQAEPSPIEPATVSTAAKASKRAPRKRTPRLSPAPTSAAKDRAHPLLSSVVTAAVSLEELAALDAENKRLRKLLAIELHAQNAQLRKMLERF